MGLINKLIFAVSLFLLPLIICAESTPAQRVEAMIGSIKEKRSISPTLDYVHWETAYRNLSPRDLQVFQASSPESLKAKMQQLFAEPEVFIREQLTKQMPIQNLPPAQKEMVDSLITNQSANLKSKMDQEIAKLIEYRFEVLDTQINGNLAKVSVQFSSATETKKDTLSLEQIDGEWWLAMTELQKNSGMLGTSSTQAKQ